MFWALKMSCTYWNWLGLFPKYILKGLKKELLYLDEKGKPQLTEKGFHHALHQFKKLGKKERWK